MIIIRLCFSLHLGKIYFKMNTMPAFTKKWSVLSALLLFIVIGFTDCNSAKQVAYFQDVADSVAVVKRVRTATYTEPTVNIGDVLSIEVTTIDAKIGGNVANADQMNNVNSDKVQEMSGYVVDKNGYIEMPMMGRMHVVGMTTMQIKELVREQALKIYKEPLVSVRIGNFSITVLGEVKSPGRYVVTGEKINIIDALGLAGDMTLGGKRDNVIVIREENGESVFTRVNMNSTDIFQSKYFYLQSGDKLYVEPLKAYAKAGTSNRSIDRILSLSIGAVSVLVAATTLAIRL